MYIVKNALRCMGRAKGRTILIGIIALVIAVSACIGLSIRQAAEHAKETAMESMTVTATVSLDRQSMMSGMGGRGESGQRPEEGGFDRDKFAEQMGSTAALTKEDYETYATAESVESFYYTQTVYLNGSDALEPVTVDTEESATDNGRGGRGPTGMMGSMASGDFTLIGYSSDAAMTDFENGSATVSEGAVFEEGISDNTCIVSSELADFNGLAVGDTLTLINPKLETETFTLTVVGIYQSSAANDFSLSMFGTAQDPANRIYLSAATLETMLQTSEQASTTVTDEETGRSYETALAGTISATYVFADVSSYRRFEEEARALGLPDSYTVSSADVAAFENSLTPLNTLSTMAGWFLLVILIIGAVILVVLNIFNVRERKYEIGVLTAMGMKKWKVATQFLCEILIVTMVAILLGAALGAVSALPVTNALLENQIESQTLQQSQLESSFGRPGGMGGGRNDAPSELPPDDGRSGFGGMMHDAAAYVSKIDSAMNLTVVLQLLGIGLLLSLVAGAVSVLFVMRYDPLRILANRD